MIATLQLLAASLAYAVGGLFMKASQGATRPGPTAAFLVLFSGGALLQAAGMKSGDLSVTYIFVLGVEALAAVLLGAFYFHEALTLSRLAAVLLIVVGIAWLRVA